MFFCSDFIGWLAPSMMVIDKHAPSGETEHLKVGALFFDDSTRTCVMLDGWNEEVRILARKYFKSEFRLF